MQSLLDDAKLPTKCFLSGWHEIEIILVPRDEMVVAQDEGVWRETGFVSSGSESPDSRTLEELSVIDFKRAVAVCRGSTDSLARCCMQRLPENGRWLYRCQGLTCDKKNQGRRPVDLVPFVFPSKDGHGYTRDVCAE